jgi:GGDEF domain-containing protein
MPIATDLVARHTVLVPTPRTSVETVDASTLLPSRAQLFDRLTDQLPTVADKPAVLLLIGLLRKDDGWPTPGSTLATATTLLARSARGEDWIARSGPSEFALVLHGCEETAETAATRVLATIADAGVPDLTAAAGIADLGAELTAGEVHRRANLCLTAARSVGAGQVIRYRGTR